MIIELIKYWYYNVHLSLTFADCFREWPYLDEEYSPD